MDKIGKFALVSVSYTQTPNIHPMRREMLQKFCINYYLPIKNTNRRFSDNMVHYYWIIFFVIIVSAIPFYLLAAILYFFQNLIKRQSHIGWIWLWVFLPWEIINFVLNENLGSTGGSLGYCMNSDFSLSLYFNMLNYTMYFLQLASKIQPDFVSLHFLWW